MKPGNRSLQRPAFISGRNVREKQKSLLIVCALMIVAFCSMPLQASQSATATKDCVQGQPCTVTSAQFTIATAQTIQWQASYTGTPTEGHGFYLSTTSENLAEIPLATGGQLGGTHFLSPGTYFISIKYFAMGPGAYTVIYNQTASISVSPSSHGFGSFVANSASSAPSTFTISNNGDADVTINSVSSPDSHFQVTGAPVGSVIASGAAKTFKVQFNPGSSAGTFSENITISGTPDIGPAGPVSKIVNVSGTTTPNVPHISCSGTPSLGAADWSTGEIKIFSRAFQNTGTALLTLNQIELINDSTGGSFSFSGPPSLVSVGPGATRSVAISFAPPNTGMDVTYSGHLVIHSNDPSGLVICAFTALAHHPVPKMRLQATSLDYHQVELGFAFTKAIIIYNDGDAPLTGTVTNTSIGDPNLAQWESLETGAFTINPGDPPRIFREIFKPLAPPGVHTIHMQVNDNDTVNPSADITLTGEGIAPVPIDSVLVMDRSGSMADSAGSRRKIDALQTAADMFVHLLRPDTGSGTGDQIGLVRFNQDNDVYLPLGFVTPTDAPGTQLAQAEGKLSPASVNDPAQLGPQGTTGIGGGIQRAAGMFSLPPDGRKHVMVLLTDGIENQAPFIGDVLGPVRMADPSLKMYSIGLGSDVDPMKLQQISNVTNGYHQVAGDLSGVSRYDLETFYFKIFSNANAMQLAVDPTRLIPLNAMNPVVIETAEITSSDRSAIFLVLDEPSLRPFYDLELVAPQGQIIDLGTSVAGIPVQRLQRYNYSIYRVVFPDAAQASSYAGTWTLRLTPRTISEFSPSAPKLVSWGGFQSNQNQPRMAPVGFVAAVKSDYRMDVAVLPSSYSPGADVQLTVSLTDRGWPSIKGNVFVDVKAPDGTVYSGLQLYDDGTHGDTVAGDGTWTGHFAQTSQSGSYKFLFHATGANERGELVPREDTRYVTLMPPSVDPTGKPCSCGSQDSKPGDSIGRLLYSFHVGSTHPLGSLADIADSNIQVAGAIGYRINPLFNVKAIAGLSQFTAAVSTGLQHPRWIYVSPNLQAVLPITTNLYYYAQAGPGWYHGKDGSNNVGFNLGSGLQVPINHAARLEFGASYHQILNGLPLLNPSTHHGPAHFLTFQLGVVFQRK